MKKVRKFVVLLMAALMVLSMAACAKPAATETPAPAAAPAAEPAAAPAAEPAAAPAAEPAAEPAAPAFTPEATGEWVINYNPGSGADLFTRACVQAMNDEGICSTTMPVVSKPEGSGVVAIQYVIDITNQKQANNTLMTLGGGDLTQAVELAGVNDKGIRPLAVMAAETPLLVKAKDGKYATFMDAVEAMKNGTQVVFCGPQNDYELMAKEIRDEIGVTDEVFTYIPYKSGKEGLTALIGGHADFALCTPAHGSELIASGDVVPQFVYSPDHYQFGDMVDLPTLSEISGGAFKDHEYHVYRVVVASAKMSDEAADFWVDVLKKITESKSFQDYCAKMSLSVYFLPKDEALPLM